MLTETFIGEPRYLSHIPENQDLTGARKASEDLRVPLLPQGDLIAGVLEAKKENGRPLYRNVVVQVPRRSAKTSSIQSVLLSRCFNIPGYQVVSTAQTQKIARKIFIDMIHVLNSTFPDENNRPYKPRVGNGQEEIRWDNGSVWWVVAPRSTAFRSSAADVVWFDEAGEYTVQQTEDLEQSALPLMDTKPNGQVIVSGTPPQVRAGMLWDYLKLARTGEPGYGIVDFSMDPKDDPTDEDIWWRVHAGLASGLTEIETIRYRLKKLGLVRFQREYLCADPVASSIRAIPEDDWLATQVPEMLALPEKNFAIAFDSAIDGSIATISFAWFDEKGYPCVQIVDQRAGTSWLVKEIAKYLKAYPGIPIGYDAIGHNLSVNQSIQSQRHISTSALTALSMQQASAGVSLMTSAISDHALRHAKDPVLDKAVEEVSFRFSGDSRLFGRRQSGADISPLVSCSHALFLIAGEKTREPRKRRAPITF
jgi:hypothetical protein